MDSSFPEGLMFELPREGAPEFVKGRLSIHVPRLKKWLDENVNERGYIDIDLKKSKAGKLYLQKRKEVQPPKKTL